jgi:glucokinase
LAQQDSHESSEAFDMAQHSYSSDAVSRDALSNQDYVVGVDLGGTNLRLALADRTGSVVGRWSNRTVGVTDPSKIVAMIASGVEQLLLQSGAPRSAIQALAVGAPGITDAASGVVIATSYLMGWRNVPLRSLLESCLGIPVAVDNDVNVAAIGESWRGAAKQARDFVFVAIGSGVGAGIVLNGQLYHGRGWTAGEIGYMLVPGASETPVASGRPGPLEALVGGEGIRSQWHSLWSEERTSLSRDLTATQIFDHAQMGDPLAQRILQQTARALAYALYDIALVLNCPLFVLGGGVGTHPALHDATRKILEQRGARARPELACSTLGEDAQLTGAIRLALDTANTRTTPLL